MITFPPRSFRISLSGFAAEVIAEVESADEADGHANCGNQQNQCWCHVLVSPCPLANGAVTVASPHDPRPYGRENNKPEKKENRYCVAA